MTDLISTDRHPWYKEPWPWLLMMGPFIVVVAGLTTAWLAVKSDDGLVTADYYQKGLNINQTLLSSEQARKYGLSAGIRTRSDGLLVRLQAKDQSFPPPSRIIVTISHPTRAGLDQSFILQQVGNVYRSDVLHFPVTGHWLVLLEDDKKNWRMMGNLILPAQGETYIGLAQPAEAE